MNVTRTVVGLVLALAILRPAPAESQENGQLQNRIVALEALVATLQGQIAGMGAETAARQAADTTLQANIDAEAAARLAADATLQQNINNVSVPQNLLDLAAFVSVDFDTINDLVGPHVIFTGTNVHIRNGTLGTTGLSGGGTANGRGNLIVGYNEVVPAGFLVPAVRTGSHNLVVGPSHTYSALGGFVAGSFNAVTSDSASVSAGWRNTASGIFSSVSGGFANTANGGQASVSGGARNTASGVYSSVSGGDDSTASGDISSVSGGYNNTASHDYSTVSGGSDLATAGHGLHVP